MRTSIRDLVWRGIQAANPWWATGSVPAARTRPYRRHAFRPIYDLLRQRERGRGIVLLGPRRVGKTVLLHQVVEQLLEDGVHPASICLISVDDVALRDRELGALMDLVDARMPCPSGVRFLLLDEVQHSPSWARWLKRLADRRDPVVFLATGSSATALLHGGQDSGVGRWRELTLFPWSFREHVQLTRPADPVFERMDRALADPELRDRPWQVHTTEADILRLDAALVDYLLRGGFPEAAEAEDLVEARRRLRQDILDRSLGRDIVDAMNADPRTLERMFLRICLHPGGLWNTSEVSRDLGISRPSVTRYLDILERAFLVFRFPNLHSPVRGQPRVYLVAPSLRQALLGLTAEHLETPEEWGRMAENAMAATLVGTRPTATHIGFWRRGNDECDGVCVDPPGAEYIEVKRSGRRAVRGLRRAREAVGLPGPMWVLSRAARAERLDSGPVRLSLAAWLYQQDAAEGGTLRIRM